MLAVIDSGGANLGSVMLALDRVGVRAVLTRDPVVVAGADRILLPGVGAFDPVMEILDGHGLTPVLRAARQPLFGICVGMQVLYHGSDEGQRPGLGLIPGRVCRLPASPRITVPHMGWNGLALDRPGDPLLAGLAPGDAAYFVHSFAVAVDGHCLAHVVHGRPIAALVRHGAVVGCQFHPERSAATGHTVLKNFALG